MKKHAIIRLSAPSTYVKIANTSLGGRTSSMSFIILLNGLRIFLLSLLDLAGNNTNALNRYISTSKC